MKKHYNFQLVIFVVLLCIVLGLPECKKREELSSSAPTASTNKASWINNTWATLNGLINANNQITTAFFEFDTITTYGHSIIATPDTITGSATTFVSANLTGLTPGKIYHYRVKAVSSAGISYGSDSTFTTSGTGGSIIILNPDLTYSSVSDNDGNTYKTIEIGTQTWMAENLKTTKYNDNTTIPLVTGNAKWAALSTPGYSWYNNDSITYGVMYNWYAVNTVKLCPLGWHVPTDPEWTTLTTYLGGDSIAGDQLKETGLTHWLSPNAGATNESGFTALPGGYRSYDGKFSNLRSCGYWWSSTEYSSIDAYYRDMYTGYRDVDRSNGNKLSGFSVRCSKDNLNRQ
jgi:uncharacterized protein (TIGR02145 family)